MVGKKKKLWIIWGVGILLLIFFAFGISMILSGRCIKVYGKILYVEKIYFDDDEKSECSLRNPYYKQIVSALKELSKQETVEPVDYSYSSDFTIRSHNDIRCEIFNGRTSYSVPTMVGYVDTYNYSVLGVRICKDEAVACYYYRLDADEASQVWKLIWKAKEWEE